MDTKDKRTADGTNEEEIDRIAREILSEAHDTLVMMLRFMDMALSRFTLFPVSDDTLNKESLLLGENPLKDSILLTDGNYLLYNARNLFPRYKIPGDAVTWDYLHVTLHCVFRHMYAAAVLERPTWDLATDIAVANIIEELRAEIDEKRNAAYKKYGNADFITLRSTEKPDPLRRERQNVLNRLKKELGVLTAEKLYNLLRSDALTEVQKAQIRGLFYADNHVLWYMTDEQKQMHFGLPSSGSGEKQQEQWQKVSESMQMELETFLKQPGTAPGHLMQNLREVNREKYDYTAFLKKFAVRGEVMKLNPDEFDYVYYTYGLKLYENLPLIEPLEYRDVMRIREFVIAIDTSGSTSGELVQTFLQKTYNILKTTESFFNKINLHIIQCDAEIQEHAKITSQEEFDEYLKRMKIRGLGGTDFRPVFRKVNELVEAKEFTNLKGLIYFTDGYGTFPKDKPAYETAFVFVEDGFGIPEVPSWAIKLVLRRDEI